MEQKPPVGLMLGLLIGLIAGVVVSGLWTNRKVRAGWNLVPVVVASQDIEEGTVITFEYLNQRSIPEQFVTSNVVLPETATYIINQKLRVSVVAGDPLHWSYFETSPSKPAPGRQPAASDSAR
ncbi:SAF domain-containing protein [Archangium lansingense]|uniref:SAF domain-containing protein n=1 Tax=Archangium lansingense TaxID=2995310 RepID=A0ABT3ZU45_9BACT|nr:SAF domain-containing protein [Archangium lansinium]MCY1072912.1 SAF domain-containing protein [Archangium lansinium]